MLLLRNKYYFILLAVWTLSCESVFAQNKDTIVQHFNRYNLFSSLESHIGWAPQKYVYAGFQLEYVLLFRVDGGFDVFSTYPNRHKTSFSLQIIYPGFENKDTSRISEPFVSFNITTQFPATVTSSDFYTLNIGWISQRQKDICYIFSAGGGIKVATTLPKVTLFLGIDLSIGYKFF
jgi:hypothetical protein